MHLNKITDTEGHALPATAYVKNRPTWRSREQDGGRLRKGKQEVLVKGWRVSALQDKQSQRSTAHCEQYCAIFFHICCEGRS
jgi:hypothetical protein